VSRLEKPEIGKQASGVGFVPGKVSHCYDATLIIGSKTFPYLAHIDSFLSDGPLPFSPVFCPASTFGT
jgi:hypothetical protein